MDLTDGTLKSAWKDIFAELEMVKVAGSNIIGLQKWVGPVPPTYNVPTPMITPTVTLRYSRDHLHLHLADAFIQSDLQCIQVIHFYCQYMCSLGIEPTTFALLTQCSNHWATGSLICMPPTFAYTRPCSRPAEPAQPHHQKFCRYCEETSEDNSKNGRSWK